MRDAQSAHGQSDGYAARPPARRSELIDRFVKHVRVSNILDWGALCAPQAVSSLEQATPIPVRADFAWAGSTRSQCFYIGAYYTHTDFGGFINLPVHITELRAVYAATHPAAKLGRSPTAVAAGEVAAVGAETDQLRITIVASVMRAW